MFLEVNRRSGDGVIASCVFHAKYKSFSFGLGNDCFVSSLEPISLFPLCCLKIDVRCFDWPRSPSEETRVFPSLILFDASVACGRC